MQLTNFGESLNAPVPRPTAAQRANLRANLTRLARDPEDAAPLIAMLEDDR